MHCVFQASNNIEAHMIKDLLDHQGVSAWVEGELLQGGMGELQAIGLVRVVVNDMDQNQAADIIACWQNAEPELPHPVNRRSSFNFYQGFVVGSMLMFLIMVVLKT